MKTNISLLGTLSILLVLAQVCMSKMTFNKDLEINGTLFADKGDFNTLNIR